MMLYKRLANVLRITVTKLETSDALLKIIIISFLLTHASNDDFLGSLPT